MNKIMANRVIIVIDDEDDAYGSGDDEVVLAHGWRPPRGGKRAQRDNCS